MEALSTVVAEHHRIHKIKGCELEGEPMNQQCSSKAPQVYIEAVEVVEDAQPKARQPRDSRQGTVQADHRWARK
eukprot:CAMPEP_0179360590 /NCGR_PEP_ID=MMETSP0797-20121207/80059_1 /TAXON_ID=47934 /ORGANISM="Dinophysis acuminata, Strain DAEP01" /LENGTH=73 /DNA_ID=CAMNT_0021075957 /DNA_START=344 /DNA_END=565 /DNA_ORIENTATION=-